MAASMRSRSRASASKESRLREERQVVQEPVVIQPWTPSAYTAFKVLLSARLCAAIWNHISDCDEVFNYWEPIHYILHGSGFQTWEYSPVYAIRSYAYLWLHAAPLQLYATLLQANKVLQFYFLRCLLGFVCALCEVYFYRGICKHYGTNTGRLSLVFMLFSSGMFISSAALLPSSFTMYATMTAMAAWFLGHHEVAIFSIAVSAIVGWPFAGAIGIPIAWDFVVKRRRLWMFVKWSFLSGVVCLVPLVQIDSHYYGGLVIAPLNIILYNVFSEHGPDIYGVEPWHFYFLNGFLNFNIVFILALLSLPLTLLLQLLLKPRKRGLPLWLTLTPMYLWALIFFTRPHKEERFLFPIYPLVCLAAAITLDHLQKLYHHVFGGRSSNDYVKSSSWLALTCGVLFTALSISRTMALHKGYHAPLDVYVELTRISSEGEAHVKMTDINVCVGKEWYRFPSSFFLPDDRWHLQFIKSDFRGQLPKPFEKGHLATRKEPSHMNDMNIEEPSRYINISRCHYLVDLDVARESKLEPRYSTRTKEWGVVASAKFLDAAGSNRLLRAFYIPFFSEQNCDFVSYNLLKRLQTPNQKTRRPGRS